MLKRIIPIASACVICIVMILSVPLQGHAMSFNGKDLQYSVLQFDYIESYYSKIPCPFNSASQGTYREPFEFGDMLVNGYVSMPNGSNAIEGFISGLAGSCVSFYSSLQIVRLNDLNTKWSYWVSPALEGMILGGADITFSVVTLNGSWSNSNELNAAHHTITGTIPVNLNGSIDIGQGLYELLVDAGYQDPYIMLYDLSITVPFVVDNVGTPCLFVSTVTNGLDPNLLYGQWVGNQHIVFENSTGSSDHVNFDVVSWLKDATGSFLDFEIAPGFSFNKILWIILVVGLLLWFFKLFS